MSSDQYMRLCDEYRSTKGHDIYWTINSVAVSHGLFLGNHDELLKKLTAHSQLPGVARLFHQGHRDEMQAEFREIMRLLHNYVAAVKSLVDHTRRIARMLLDGRHLQIYQDRIDVEFRDDPSTSFLHDLRNYLLHVSHPPVRSTIRFKEKDLEFAGIELSPSQLLEWDNWRKTSIEFIETHNDGIVLAPLVATYERKVFGFYEWLIDHLNTACKPQLDEFWAKHNQWAAFCRENGIPTTDEEFRDYLERDSG